MYGLVNQAIKDLVLAKFGEEKWREICKKAAFEDVGFVKMQSYPDHITYQLVGAASQVLQLNPNDILKAFGEHWILYTAESGYGEMLTFYLGKDVKSALLNLNQLHTRLGMVMTDLVPPRFVVKEINENQLHLEYHSKREGLAPMVIGLLEGICKRFETTAKIVHVGKIETQNYDLFIINL